MKPTFEASIFLDTLVSKIDIGVITFDMDGFITLINGKAIDFLGLTGNLNSFLGTGILNHLKIPELLNKIKLCLQDHLSEFHITNIFYKNRYLILDGKQLLDGMLLSITDITENVLAKDEATQSLLLGQELERRRLAKEIHDGVGPTMSTLKLQIDSIKRKAISNQVIADLEDINQAISAIASDIRQISHDLMPSSLVDFGVVTALSNFSKKISATSDIDVHYHTNIKDAQLTKEYELNIFRIIQELVNNAIKYSRCTNIEISFRNDEDGINILVQDDGMGMEITDVKNGIGLFNIRTRVASLRGFLDLESKKNEGVTVFIHLPFTPQNKSIV